ncbi:hypothetical protein GQ53DRAFT_819466 [Thozetella sp. PMI_491]|nr:hypothetical protein GQ53DRAFT_819466 [Thozetella sp. PMI_491]
MTVGGEAGMGQFSLMRDWRLAFTPFLAGPRNCPGGHVAIRVAIIAYAYIVINYKIRWGPVEAELEAHL